MWIVKFIILALKDVGYREYGRQSCGEHGGEFNWIVYKKRSDINVEPNKSDVPIYGDGPYKYYMPNIVT